MAEAFLQGQSSELKKFFCHMCNVEIRIPSAEYNCPLCAGGFVEEIPSSPSDATTSQNSLPSSSNHINVDPNQRRANLESLRDEIATLLMSRNGPNLQLSSEPANRDNNEPITLPATASTSSFGLGGLPGGRILPGNFTYLDNILMQFFRTLSSVDNTASSTTNPSYNPHMFFVGNPGDYAWGREGLDTIVTQLLNQMDTSGPPPLSSDKIEEIEKVAVTQEEVDTKMRCSVCWDDFRLEEVVRKLPCSHLYHEDCIVPWLKLHGTCPICRKSLDNGDEANPKRSPTEASNNLDMLNFDNLINNFSSPQRPNVTNDHNNNNNTNASTSQQSSSSPSSSSQQPQQPIQNSNNHVFDFDDNTDLPLD